MKMLIDLFSTDYGLMSIGGIAFMLGMAVFLMCGAFSVDMRRRTGNRHQPG